jgi:ASPIC and UnbV/SprB repeat/FG-GAP-like repeat
MKNILLFLLSFSITHVVMAQYTIVTNDFNVAGNSHYNNGTGLSFFDFDKDGWDDLTMCDYNMPIRIYKNNQQGGFTLIKSIPNTWDAKQPIWVDYDNDMDYDLFISIYHHSAKLYRNDGGVNNLVDVTADLNLPNLTANTFGCSWGDYDKDGFLDVYLSNWMDDTDQITTNWLLHNNGNGTFTDVTVAKGVGNGAKSTFQSVWADFDLNGWPDLYVVNDHNFPNALYLNTNGNFVDATASTNTGITINSMCNSVSDYDNDGDFDIYVTNGFNGNYLLNNNNLVFTNVATSSGTAINAQSWNGQWIDANNDGWEDLHVCVGQPEVPNMFFMNSGMGFFEESEMPPMADDNWTYSAAKGDYNNDGYADFASYSQLPTQVCLWGNNFEHENQWIKYGLSSTLGHPDGYGSLIKCYFNNMCVTQTTMCGDNYISQDSQYKIIGLGNSSVVDSLVITWPSGWVDTFYDLPINQFYALEEGQSLFAQLPNLQTIVICNTEQATLSIGDFATYEWSNGQTTSSIIVNEIGEYDVTVTTDEGFMHTYYFTVDVDDLVVENVNVTEPDCAGNNTGSIEISLNNQNYQTVSWSKNGEDLLEENNLLSNIAAGIYEYEITTHKNCTYTGSVQVNEPALLNVEWNAPPACYEGATSIQLEVTGGTGNYAYNWYGINPNEVTIGEYDVTITDANECSSTHTIYVQQYQPINISFYTPLACYEQATQVQAFVTGGAGNFELDWSGANPNEVYAGTYTLSATDNAGCTASANYTILQSTEIIVTAQITEAEEDDDEGSIQLTVTGGYAPYSYAWSNGATTSGIEDVEQGIYTCTITDALQCSQEITVQVIDTKMNEMENNIIAYPNPCSDRLNIQLPTPQDIRIYNAYGQLVYHTMAQVGLVIIDTSEWSGGAYSVVGDYYVITILNH